MRRPTRRVWRMLIFALIAWTYYRSLNNQTAMVVLRKTRIDDIARFGVLFMAESRYLLI